MLIDVGIMLAESIDFVIDNVPLAVRVRDGRLEYGGMLHDELSFGSPECAALDEGAAFTLRNVPIGIDFHWQQTRDLSYCGSLRFVVEDGRVRAINRIELENYLLSVISSEMKADANLQLLKAHAVISRSWVVARMLEFNAGAPDLPHRTFVVCADDHCQRYQGVGMATGDKVRRAIDETRGLVLSYDGQICDARYSKCCGGMTELFSSCWEDFDPPYLKAVPDTSRSVGMPMALVGAVGAIPPIDDQPFCSCRDARILSQVLNDYDLQTDDFYEWTERRSRQEFSRLILDRTGVNYGTLLSLEPLRRGPSGRIVELRVVGSLRTGVIGKELAIRRALSPSHLKSSCFDVSYEGDDIVLRGRGWGHGVGLCQIGAAVMAARGYTWRQILSHYYPGSVLGGCSFLSRFRAFSTPAARSL